MGDNYKGKESKEKKFTDKPEKADLNFNKAETVIENKVEPKVEVKSEIVKAEHTNIEKFEVKPEVKSESKVEVKPHSQVKHSGEVICVTAYSYIVKTKDGKGVLVTGKHNKKIGDIV